MPDKTGKIKRTVLKRNLGLQLPLYSDTLHKNQGKLQWQTKQNLLK